jgi:hypothetical protein
MLHLSMREICSDNRDHLTPRIGVLIVNGEWLNFLAIVIIAQGLAAKVASTGFPAV